VAVIVTLAGKVDHRLYEVTDRSRRDTRLYRALKSKAAAAQAAAQGLSAGAGCKSFCASYG